MKEWIELYKNQKIDDLYLGYECKDDFVNSLNVYSNIGEDYFNKAEEIFLQDKIKAFEYYKLAYKNGYWIAPYMMGIYFEYGLGDCIKSKSIAFDFYKEAINKDDIRGYVQIAELIDDIDKKLILWKKFFEHKLIKEIDYSLLDFAHYNIDYRLIFLYKFKSLAEYENKILEIIDIIKPSLIKDYEILVNQIQNLSDEDIEEDLKQEIINLLDLVINGNEEYFLVDEDMSIRLEKLIKKDKKWD